MGIDEEDWDYVLIGDGSGANWSTCIGWGCVSVERRSGKRQAWYGGMSLGTVNLAEMLAYIQPLSWIVAEAEKRRKAEGVAAFYKVHIITDSEYCQKQGDKKTVTPAKNGSFWRIFDDFERQGLSLNWHWLRREEAELNRFADALSKAARARYKIPEAETCPVLAEAGRAASGLSQTPLDRYNPPKPEEPVQSKRRKKRRKRT